AICGGVLLFRRSRRDLTIVIAPIVATALSAAVTFGSTRYRALAEPSIAVLAAVGAFLIVEYVVRVRRRNSTRNRTLDTPRVPEGHI
ncbi:MAG: hypothetical protein ACRDYE_14185, partial [Acidimicrobiales bacterium]